MGNQKKQELRADTSVAVDLAGFLCLPFGTTAGGTTGAAAAYKVKR